jgi:hypothetical protein
MGRVRMGRVRMGRVRMFRVLMETPKHPEKKNHRENERNGQERFHMQGNHESTPLPRSCGCTGKRPGASARGLSDSRRTLPG